jgi:imidazolonepropionase-like amidohydrolase
MTLIVKAARVVWDADETAISDGQVVIEQDRIREVHSAAARPADEVADVIDLGSATIVPGLIDSHGHISNNTSYRESLAVQNQVDLMVATLRGVANLRDDLRTGVTTMRTLGGPDKLEVRFRDAIAANQVDGPRLQIAIRLFRPTHGTAAFVGTTADGPDELRFRVRETFFFGADWIKLLITNVMHGETMRDYLLGDLTTVPSYTRAEIEAAIDEAHTLGMKVAAHAMGGPALRWAIEAGIDSIEHGNMLEDDDVELFAKHGTYLSDPNLQLKFDSDEIKAKRSHGLPAEEWWRDKIAASAAHWRRAIPRLLDAGVKICLGVDSSHGNLWREAGHLYDLGATPAQALGAVTKNGAALLGLSDQVGALRPGMRADLVGIDGDPLTDPWCLGRVTFVMKDGRVVWQSGQRPDAMLSPIG